MPYKFAPLNISEAGSTFSKGGKDDITYRLNQQDTDFFVNSDTVRLRIPALVAAAARPVDKQLVTAVGRAGL